MTVYVTRAQRTAARILTARLQHAGRPVPHPVALIADARP